jgi:hypothetical protein
MVDKHFLVVLVGEKESLNRSSIVEEDSRPFQLLRRFTTEELAH